MSANLPGRLLRRARLLRSCIRGPRDAWVTARMVGWRLALPALKWALPLPRLVRLMWRDRPSRATVALGRERIATLVWGLYGPRGGPLLDNCLERSLMMFRFLAEAGADPQLVVAVSQDGRPVRGHAWVALEGRSVGETTDPLDEFAPVVTFGRGGDVVGAGA